MFWEQSRRKLRRLFTQVKIRISVRTSQCRYCVGSWPRHGNIPPLGRGGSKKGGGRRGRALKGSRTCQGSTIVQKRRSLLRVPGSFHLALGMCSIGPTLADWPDLAEEEEEEMEVVNTVYARSSESVFENRTEQLFEKTGNMNLSGQR